MSPYAGVRCPVCRSFMVDGRVSPYGAWVFTCSECGRVFSKAEGEA